jgi:hypothetical protein
VHSDPPHPALAPDSCLYPYLPAIVPGISLLFMATPACAPWPTLPPYHSCPPWPHCLAPFHPVTLVTPLPPSPTRLRCAPPLPGQRQVDIGRCSVRTNTIKQNCTMSPPPPPPRDGRYPLPSSWERRRGDITRCLVELSEDKQLSEDSRQAICRETVGPPNAPRGLPPGRGAYRGLPPSPQHRPTPTPTPWGHGATPVGHKACNKAYQRFNNAGCRVC